MPECFVAKSSVADTAGNFQDILVCYCGTTACTKQRSYELPKDFQRIKSVEFDNELTPEEEKAFYKHVMSTAFNKPLTRSPQAS